MGRLALEVKKAETLQVQTAPPAQAVEAITDYCAEAATNLSNFTHEQWREFVRTVIGEITFFGDRITIQGRIPVQLQGQDAGRDYRLDGVQLSTSNEIRT